MMAVGVARPNAQGHEITSTAIAMEIANSRLCPYNNHITAASRAIQMTAGTKTALILSARRPIGAFDDEASSTSRIIWARVVSSPTLVALKTK